MLTQKAHLNHEAGGCMTMWTKTGKLVQSVLHVTTGIQFLASMKPLKCHVEGTVVYFEWS